MLLGAVNIVWMPFSSSVWTKTISSILTGYKITYEITLGIWWDKTQTLDFKNVFLIRSQKSSFTTVAHKALKAGTHASKDRQQGKAMPLAKVRKDKGRFLGSLPILLCPENHSHSKSIFGEEQCQNKMVPLFHISQSALVNLLHQLSSPSENTKSLESNTFGTQLYPDLIVSQWAFQNPTL